MISIVCVLLVALPAVEAGSKTISVGPLQSMITPSNASRVDKEMASLHRNLLQYYAQNHFYQVGMAESEIFADHLYPDISYPGDENSESDSEMRKLMAKRALEHIAKQASRRRATEMRPAPQVSRQASEKLVGFLNNFFLEPRRLNAEDDRDHNQHSHFTDGRSRNIFDQETTIQCRCQYPSEDIYAGLSYEEYCVNPEDNDNGDIHSNRIRQEKFYVIGKLVDDGNNGNKKKGSNRHLQGKSYRFWLHR